MLNCFCCPWRSLAETGADYVRLDNAPYVRLAWRRPAASIYRPTKRRADATIPANAPLGRRFLSDSARKQSVRPLQLVPGSLGTGGSVSSPRRTINLAGSRNTRGWTIGNECQTKLFDDVPFPVYAPFPAMSWAKGSPSPSTRLPVPSVTVFKSLSVDGAPSFSYSISQAVVWPTIRSIQTTSATLNSKAF